MSNDNYNDTKSPYQLLEEMLEVSKAEVERLRKSPTNEVVIVIGNKAHRVHSRVWMLFVECAGQMIRDGDIFDYYKNREPKKTLHALADFFNEVQ